jgi:hypothetical protein
MKVLILGLDKSGTTGMVYKVAGGLPNCHVFRAASPENFPATTTSIPFLKFAATRVLANGLQAKRLFSKKKKSGLLLLTWH